MKPTLLFLLLFLFVNSLPSSSQILLTDIATAPASATCQATVAQTGLVALFNNQAGLTEVKKFAATVATEWRFGVKDLKPIAFGLVLPAKSGVFGFTFNHFSFETTQQNAFGLVFAKKMSPKMSAALGLKMAQYGVTEYGSTLFISFEVGFYYQLFDDIKVGFHTQNPLQQKIGVGDFTPSVFRLGAAYQVNEAVDVNVECAKDNVLGADFRLGVNYKINPTLVLRGGIATLPTRFAFGLGYHLSEKFVMDLGLSSHTILGLTPSVNLSYQLKASNSKPNHSPLSPTK